MQLRYICDNDISKKDLKMRFHHQHRHDEHQRHSRHGFGWDGHGMRGMGRHGRGARSERGERVFEQGDLRLLLLKLIAEKPRHGYDLIKAVEEAVGGAYSPSPGVVYPTLTLLEDLGYARVQEAEGGKKLYAITDEGTAFLETQGPALEELKGRIESAAAAGNRRNAPQIVRAMGNLGMALHLRLSRGALSEDQIGAIAAAIDAAAQAVEKA
jgi:DNA-binding PadR family transcriptional regulator